MEEFADHQWQRAQGKGTQGAESWERGRHITSVRTKMEVMTNETAQTCGDE